MNGLLSELRSTQYSEVRPRYVLIIDPSNSAVDTPNLISEFPVGTYVTEFRQVMPGVFYTYASGLGLVLREAIRNRLGHSNFVLSEIV